MAWTIWKYTIPVQDKVVLSMPVGAQVLSVQVQNGQPQMWALIDEDWPRTTRHFRVVGTGHPVPDADEIDLTFIGTFQMEGGARVFHLFEY